MKKKIKREIALILTLALLCTVLPVSVYADNASVMQSLPDSYTAGTGSFTLSTSARFFVVSDSAISGDLLSTIQLACSEFAAKGKPSTTSLPIVWGPESYAKSGDLICKLDSSHAAEAYTITATSSNVTVSASDTNGLLYGIRGVLKLLLANSSNVVSACTIADAPDTSERTVMLDCARKYFTKNWICNYIREMSWMGYNTLELHLSEDQGIRADIWDSTYFTSSNGNDYSWICGSKLTSWIYSCTDPDSGKYLTAAELIEILDTAKEYHIAVIPDFDSPGHCNYLTQTYNAYVAANPNYTFTYDGKTYSASGITENGTLTAYSQYTTSYPRTSFTRLNIGTTTYDCVDVANLVARAFILSVISDYADFFKTYAGSTDFNIGADEVSVSSATGWDTYASAHVTGGSTAYDTFTDYLNTTADMLQGKGYTVRAFNDYLCRSDANVSLDSQIGVVYWDTPSASTARNASYFVSEGRKIYNAVQNYCYYVLRVFNHPSYTSNANYNKDARDPTNTWWAFNRGTAERVYAEWNPSLMYEYGSSSPVVTGTNLGGGYFLIWCDYAGWNTESQIWNGTDSSGTYNVIERMWANIEKMWNWDINSSVTLANYTTATASFGTFPGYTSCSAAASIPAATAATQAYLADHTALAALLSASYPESSYTAASYAAYTSAKASAQSVHDNYAATQAEVDAAVTSLQAAINALVIQTDTQITITYKTMVGATEHTIGTDTVAAATGKSFRISLPGRTGYRFSSVTGSAKYTAAYSGADCGTLYGTCTGAMSLVVWYENLPQLGALKVLLADALTAQSSFTADSWSTYRAAVDAAQAFYNSVSATPNALTWQEQVNGYTNSILTSGSSLVTTVDTTQIISASLTTDYVAVGKEAVFLVLTSPDVTRLTVSNVTLTKCCGQIAQTTSGSTVKIWYVQFPVSEAGTLSYTLTALGGSSQTLNISVLCK